MSGVGTKPAPSVAERDRAEQPRTIGDLVVLAPLGLEARAVRSALPSAQVIRSGMGQRRAERAARIARSIDAGAVVVAGFCGALDPSLVPGEIVVASEVRGPKATVPCPEAASLVAALERMGIAARHGPIVSADHIVRGSERAELAATGALAVDMESIWLAPAAAGRAFVVMRAVVDTPDRELLRPFSVAMGTARAYRALAVAGAALGPWARETAHPDDVVRAR